MRSRDYRHKNRSTEVEQKQLFEELQEEIKKRVTKLDELSSRAREYTRFGNKGKAYGDVKEREQRRQRVKVKTRAEKALWFIETF